MKPRSVLLLKLSAVIFSTAIWLLFRTLRLDFHLESPGTNPYRKPGSQRFLYCVWHDSMIIPTFGGRHHCAAALISQHGDGTFVAQILKTVGMKSIRGSTNRISTGAVRQLMTTARDRHIVITPDGPRGPYREMSIGIVYLASRTGRAIVPTAFACARAWIIRGSWTDLIIPKPFSRVVLLAGSPIVIPPDLSRDELAQRQKVLQAEMDRLDEAATQLAAAGQRRSGVGRISQDLNAA